MFNKLFKSVFAVAMVLGAAVGFVSCQPEEEKVENPTVQVSAEQLNFTNEEGSQTINVTSNANWKTENAAGWVTVTPTAGKGNKTLTVSVSMNDTGAVRTAEVKVIALHPEWGPYETVKFVVSQSADENATVDEVLLYSDDFDGKEATKNSEGYWPYIDQFPEFANPKGDAAANVTYTGYKVSVRANQPSNQSTYSNYAGSGSNNIFFGDGGYFVVNNIAPLSADDKNYKISFGVQKYAGNTGDSSFNYTDFLLYISKDGEKWAPVEYAIADLVDGKYNVATADFTLAAATDKLYIKFVAKVASVLRIDDLKFFVGNGGQTIDLDNIEAPQPVEAKKVTVAEFLVAAEDSTIYELTGVIKNIVAGKEYYGNFDIEDSTGSVFIYGLVDDAGNFGYFETLGLKEGDTITLRTVRTSYNGNPQGKNATYVSHTPGSGTTPEPEPGSVVTIAEAIAAADNTAIVIENATVIGVYARGVLVEDTTGKLLVYDGSAVSAEVGDVVKVEGSMATYGGLRQVATPTVTVTGSTSYTYPTATVMDGAAMDAYLSNPVINYVEYTGTLAINGYYYNVTIDGASTAVGSLAYVIEGTVDASLNGQKILVKGWTIGFSGGKYVNTMITSVTAADGGSTEPTPTPNPEPGEVVKATVLEFLDAAEGNTVYELTGEITSVANTTYGNFYLKDDTGEVYIYGLCSPEGEKQYWAESGVKVGDIITIQTVRTSYQGTPQGKDAIYVSHVSVEVEKPEIPEGCVEASIVFVNAGYANAESVDGTSIALDNNVSVVFSKGGAGTAPAYYNSGEAIRMYQNGATLDVTANGKSIKSIELTFSNNQYYLAANCGELSEEAPVRTWTGDATAVKFTSTGTDNTHRAYVSAIKVIYAE